MLINKFVYAQREQKVKKISHLPKLNSNINKKFLIDDKI